MSTVRKSETCEQQLRRMCKNIANGISSPVMVTDEETGEIRDQSASEWMEGTYDIRYLVNREKQYLGAQIMCAGGGPTVWVDTWTNEVKGYWGGDLVTESFIDNLGLNDYCEEMYGC
jgi:hypothetical protein